MGESTTITHALLTIVAISLAATFATVVITRVSMVSNTLSQVLGEKVELLKTSIVIAYVYNASQTEYVIYAKNVGQTRISVISDIDVYFSSADQPLVLYTYNESGGAGHWNYTELGSSDGIWQPGETIEIHVFTSAEVPPPYRVKLVLPTGYTVEEVIAP